MTDPFHPSILMVIYLWCFFQFGSFICSSFICCSILFVFYLILIAYIYGLHDYYYERGVTHSYWIVPLSSM